MAADAKSLPICSQHERSSYFVQELLRCYALHGSMPAIRMMRGRWLMGDNDAGPCAAHSQRDTANDAAYQAQYNPLLWHRKRRRDYLTIYVEEQQHVGNK